MDELIASLTSKNAAHQALEKIAGTESSALNPAREITKCNSSNMPSAGISTSS